MGFKWLRTCGILQMCARWFLCNLDMVVSGSLFFLL